MKAWYQSTTLWLNGLLAVFAMATTVLEVLDPQTVQMITALVPDSARHILTVIAVANLILRMKTKLPIATPARTEVKK
jgi:hypothetical protein